MLSYYIAIFAGALITVAGQLSLKKGAIYEPRNKLRNKFLSQYANRYVILGYFLFFLVTLANLYGLKKVDVIFMVIVNPLIHILVVGFSLWLFKEKLTRKQLVGIAFIIVGILIFNL